MSDGLYRIGGEEAGRRAPDRAVIRLRPYVRDDGVGHLVLLSTDSLTPERDLANAALYALYRTGRFTEEEWGALTDPRMLARWGAAERNEPLEPGRRVGRDEAADLVCLGFSRAWRDGAARQEPGASIYLPESDAGEPGLAEAAARVQEIFRAVSAGLIGRRPADPDRVRQTLVGLGFPDPGRPTPGTRYAAAPAAKGARARRRAGAHAADRALRPCVDRRAGALPGGGGAAAMGGGRARPPGPLRGGRAMRLHPRRRRARAGSVLPRRLHRRDGPRGRPGPPRRVLQRLCSPSGGDPGP